MKSIKEETIIKIENRISNLNINDKDIIVDKVKDLNIKKVYAFNKYLSKLNLNISNGELNSIVRKEISSL
jgi:hypothetical protein